MEEKKKTLCLSNQIKSHPDKLLEDHLSSVANLSREIISSKRLNLDSYIDCKILQDISYLIGAGHDCGKATVYFQDYINESNETKKARLKNKPETHHSLISSLFTYYLVKEYLSDKNLLDKKYYQYLPIASFIVVKRHHGNLANFLDETILGSEEEEILEKQVKGIDFNEINAIYKKLPAKVGFNFDFKIVKDLILTAEPVYAYGQINRYRKKYIKDLEKEKRLIIGIDEENTLFYYFITLFLYSVLLDADKTDAADLRKTGRVFINENIVDEYKKVKFADVDKNSKINKIRNEIYEEALSNLASINLDNDRILSLNVPTGTGKTLAGLSLALKLRQRIKIERKYTPRIIYSLPFLSIIDQNFDVFEDIFRTIDNKIPTSDILLKHHHLSDVVYTRGEDEFENVDKDIGKDLLLIEGWNSEIIITTFIQFFYSLISNRNRAIRKFHNITNSIVILDEIQAIPHKYWLLLNKTMEFLAECFNIYFIFVTATQPLIFDEETKEIKPLVKSKEKYFESLDRVCLMVYQGSVSIKDFKVILQKDILDNSQKDFLIVLNTINTSKKIYDYVQELRLEDTTFYYLSTNIVPRERLNRIRKIKAETQRKIIVSTQLIEAGVDISTDIVYRDFAPLDSINQVAGRCNRNSKNERGLVKIFILKQENDGKMYYPYSIYGSFIIDKTKEIFKDRGKRLNESDFLQMSEDYFRIINEGKSDDISINILKNVEELKFDELSNFKLIEEKGYYKIDVFVEADNEAKEVWQKYQELISEKKLAPFERKNEFLKIKKQFYDYIISISEKFKNKLTDFDDKSTMGYIASQDLDNLYSLETGFNRNCLDKEETMIC